VKVGGPAETHSTQWVTREKGGSSARIQNLVSARGYETAALARNRDLDSPLWLIRVNGSPITQLSSLTNLKDLIKLGVVLVLTTLSLFAENCTPFRNVNHRIIVGATINGRGPYAFLLDTGSQSTLIDVNVVKANHLINAGTVDVSGMGLHEATGWTVLDSFDVGGHNASRLRVIIYDLTRTQGPDDARIFGIIGLDFLERYNVELDRHKSCIKLSE